MVTFDPGKESMSIISRNEPEGEGFKMLGVKFDTELYMAEAIAKLCDDANWKVRTILRTNRFYDTGETINLYKTRVLGFIEYRTSAIYHCADHLLQQLDMVQTRVCNAMGVSDEEALMKHNLAPLDTRRDVAMLGLIHRSVIGLVPEQFKTRFVRAEPVARPHGRDSLRSHGRQLRSYRTGNFLQVLAHSILGLIDVYNLLPEYVISAGSVKLFQHRLQELLKASIVDGVAKLRKLFSPREPLFCHKLRRWQTCCSSRWPTGF